MTYVPDWKRELIAGHVRKARPGTCGDCGAKVLAGLDEDVAAFSVVIDAEPSTAGVLLPGEGFDVIGGEIHRRDLWRTGDTRYRAHLEHRCPKLPAAGAGESGGST